MVDRKMRGAVRSFRRSASRTATSTRLVPRSFSMPHTRYSSTMAGPARGSSQMIPGCSPRSSVASSMPKWKATATRPTITPIRQEYSSHLTKRAALVRLALAGLDSCGIKSPSSLPEPASSAPKGFRSIESIAYFSELLHPQNLYFPRPSHKYGKSLEMPAGTSCRAGVLPLPIPVRG